MKLMSAELVPTRLGGGFGRCSIASHGPAPQYLELQKRAVRWLLKDL